MKGKRKLQIHTHTHNKTITIAGKIKTTTTKKVDNKKNRNISQTKEDQKRRQNRKN